MKKTNDKEAAESALRRALAAAHPSRDERLEDEAWAQTFVRDRWTDEPVNAFRPRPETYD